MVWAFFSWPDSAANGRAPIGDKQELSLPNMPASDSACAFSRRSRLRP